MKAALNMVVDAVLPEPKLYPSHKIHTKDLNRRY